MTIIENWERETKMSGVILIVLGILVIGGFIYLIYDALKESDTERLERKLDGIIEELKELRRDKDERRRDKADT